MRTISAAQQGVLDSGTQGEFVRVSIKDSGGTFRDLSTYIPNFNPIKSVQWKEDVTSPGATCDIKLAREFYKMSLAPLVQASGANRGFDPAGSYAPLIAINREIKVEVALCPADKQPGAGDWFEVFRGRTDTVDSGSGQDISISCRDLSGRLQQQFIKTELVYSYASDGGVAKSLRIWEPQIAVTTSPLIYGLPASRGDADPGLNRFYKCSQAGTTGTTEPVWTTGTGIVDGSAKWDYVGAPTTSGRPVEEVMQNILDDNLLSGDSAITLYVPTSPSWNIRQFIQQRTFTYDALKALAEQIGWTCRFKWKAASSAFVLTLFQPTRSSPSVDHTFGTGDYAEPTKLAVDIQEIRNSVRVIYADRTDLWPDGTPKRKVVEVSDSTSISKYGELWCEIQEDETSNIDSSTEATTLANNALSDMKEPTAELDVPLTRGFPFTELNDYYTFTADGVRFDSDQSLAVVAWTQTYETNQDGKACLKTQLQLRGLPTIGADTFIAKQQHVKNPVKNTGHQRIQFQAAKTPALTFSDVVGGTRVSISSGTMDKNQLLAEYELHIYPTPGTPLDSTTLVGLTRGQDVVAPNLIPGNTYYSRVVPRFTNAGRLVRLQPSAEVSFVAGRASAGHINEGILIGDAPLNGGFETRLNASGPPDHWTVLNGTWGTDFDVMTDGNGVSGSQYLKLISRATLTKLRSAEIPLINDASDGSTRGTSRYRITAWVKCDSGNSGANNLFVVAQGVDYTGALIGAMGGSGVTFINAASKVGHWQKIEAIVSSDSYTGMRGVYVYVYQDTTGTTGQIYYVDEIRVQALGTAWYEVGGGGFTDNYEAVPGFANSWVNYGVANYSTAAFRRDQFGRVELKGLVKNGVGNLIFTLPTGYRPATNREFICTDGADHAVRVEVGNNGTVTAITAGYNNGYVSLDAISFVTF